VNGSAEARAFTRGGLIKAGAAAAFVVGAGRALGGALEGPAIGKSHDGPAYLRRTTYAPLVGTDFRVHVPGRRSLHVELVEARKLRGSNDAFSLLFRGRRTNVDGGTYRIDHRALGAFELFLNPVGRGVKGLELEAVINRIV
jgi:hypothetical protein